MSVRVESVAVTQWKDGQFNLCFNDDFEVLGAVVSPGGVLHVSVAIEAGTAQYSALSIDLDRHYHNVVFRVVKGMTFDGSMEQFFDEWRYVATLDGPGEFSGAQLWYVVPPALRARPQPAPAPAQQLAGQLPRRRRRAWGV